MSASGTPTPGLCALDGAILRATRAGERGLFAQVCGVFTAEGQPVALADTVARPGRLSLAAPCPDPALLPLRRGTWLFGGIGFAHFGHALIFAASRLWALDHGAGQVAGLLFFDRGTTGGTRPGTAPNLQAILELLGVTLPVVTIGRDERVERLIVPEQGLSTTPALLAGTDRQRAFLRRRLAPVRAAPPEGDLYISRWKLGPARAGLMFEDRIEAAMAQAGYRVFHPERAPLAEQVAACQGAARILGVDGSALHVAAFAADGRARIGILARRPHFAEALARQVTAFSGAKARVFRPPVQLYRRAGAVEASDAWEATHALPDLPALGRMLGEAGFLPPDSPAWQAPTAAETAARLALIARRTQGAALLPVAPDPAAATPGPA